MTVGRFTRLGAVLVRSSAMGQRRSKQAPGLVRATLEGMTGRRDDFPGGPQTTTLHVIDQAREALAAAGRVVPKS